MPLRRSSQAGITIEKVPSSRKEKWTITIAFSIVAPGCNEPSLRPLHSPTNEGGVGGVGGLSGVFSSSFWQALKVARAISPAKKNRRCFFI